MNAWLPLVNYQKSVGVHLGCLFSNDKRQNSVTELKALKWHGYKIPAKKSYDGAWEGNPDGVVEAWVCYIWEGGIMAGFPGARVSPVAWRECGTQEAL